MGFPLWALQRAVVVLAAGVSYFRDRVGFGSLCAVGWKKRKREAGRNGVRELLIYRWLVIFPFLV